MWFVGVYGVNWSSTIPTGSHHAHNSDFNYGEIYPNNYGNGRAYGFQLRCLQE
ncbi:MAG: hypothetical protein K2K83_02515 [Rikenella sp.]|nr:hypothetical protein [Rikenella sp.]